jgi:hypothetical protein
MGDDRPARYEEEGPDGPHGAPKVVYRASGLFMCTRVAAGLGKGIEPAPTPGWLQEKFDQGHRLESVVLGELAKQGPKLIHHDPFEQGQAVVKFDGAGQRELELGVGIINGRRVIVRGHVDELADVTVLMVGAIQQAVPAIIEVKTAGPDMWDRFVKLGLSGFPHYEWQVATYMLNGNGRGCLFVVAKKTPDGDDIARDEDGKPMILAQWVAQPPVSLARIKARIAKYEAAVDEALRGEFPDCDTSQFPCPMFGTICASKEAAEKKKAAKVDAQAEAKGEFAIAGDLQTLVAKWISDKDVETIAAKPYNKAKKTREETGKQIIAAIQEQAGPGKVGRVKLFGQEYAVSVEVGYVEPQPYNTTRLKIDAVNRPVNRGKKTDAGGDS